MSETYVQVPANSSGEKIGVTQLSNGADSVDLQHIIIADDSTYAARAKVGNADAASTDYGLTVRPVRTAVSVYRALTAASNNAANLKNAAGTVYGWDIYNNAGYPVYVKLYNKATSPAPATDNGLLIAVVGVQAGIGAELYVDVGMAGFTSGISIAVVKGISDTDNTSVAASDAMVHIFYK